MFLSVGSSAPVVVAIASSIGHLSKLRNLFGVNARELFPQNADQLRAFSGRHMFIHNSQFLAITQLDYFVVHQTAFQDSTYLNSIPPVMIHFATDLDELRATFESYSYAFLDEKLTSLFLVVVNTLLVSLEDSPFVLLRILIF